ncbi:22913_t:CDS:1, partial [Rhizophagus irregularis]
DSSERIERKRDKEVDKDKVVEPEAVMLNENKKRVVTSQGSRIDE